MKNFDWSQFSKRVFINAPLNQVYDAWTIPEKLEEWFLSKANFYTQTGIQLDRTKNAVGNSNYSWNWFAQNHHEEGKLSEANGKDFLEFSFAGNCVVQVQLTETDSITLVELSQSNIPLDDDSKEGIRLGCAFGWTFYLTNLKSTLEGGIDLRNKDTSLKGVVNN